MKQRHADAGRAPGEALIRLQSSGVNPANVGRRFGTVIDCAR
ncbi:hypothetical protein [Bradyrhizobium sp.]|nr:hypothetical protein [Bradyrhizobium sp.]